ncbi:DUF4839 domain-containing protein [Cryobacterium sp. Hz7]|uniref:DUF4839 domain-containing protein n=1 Tax=Cryobacterium sp. Hz7 TaxID=1259166 RepID=UPI001069881F|nr:DUF4839 domain-containing protein [Cryobacterium sp. Hz7]TFB62022.1 DUF4839 domain-containing protein [Cryobacterium sp. Hz7]
MLKRIITAGLVLALTLSVAACGSDTTLAADQARMPASSADFKDEEYQDVVKSLQEVGFAHVETKALGDLISGWLNSPGSVKEVEINSVASFEQGEVFQRDVTIVVSYHSFPDDAEEPSESAPPHEEPSASPDAAEEVLTVENSPDLAAFLALTDNCSAANAEFATKYKDRTIAFDGNISAMQNHGSYKTRYDFLIAPGDYSETTITGPSFQFRDVDPTLDLNLTGSNGSDTIGVGDNLQITAQVDSFDSTPCQFILEPVSTEFR